MYDSYTIPFDTDLGHKFLKVYPVLLYIDQSLSMSGINRIVQQWFAMELAHDQELGIVGYEVYTKSASPKLLLHK